MGYLGVRKLQKWFSLEHIVSECFYGSIELKQDEKSMRLIILLIPKEVSLAYPIFISLAVSDTSTYVAAVSCKQMSISYRRVSG